MNRPLKRKRRNPITAEGAGIAGIIFIWFIAFLANLALLGVIIWAIIELVQFLTGGGVG